MKNLTILIISLTATFSSAQLFDDLEKILAATTEDAQLLADAYIAPVGQSLTYGLNGGWSSSAKTHKKLGFDITVGVVSPSVPDGSKSFNINELGLSKLTTTSATASTAFGSASGTTFTETTSGATFQLPGGLEDDLILNSLPTPYLQAGVGLFFDTDLIVRYIPKSKFKGFEVDLFGVGIKHNLMQYLGLLDKLPLNVSALASYSKLNGEYFLNDLDKTEKLTLGVDTFLVQALASLDFPIISVMAGFGYSNGDVAFNMLGDYSTIYPGTPKDPLSSEKSYSGAHGLVGLRANLLFLKIFANYTLQEFNTLNVGVSISFR